MFRIKSLNLINHPVLGNLYIDFQKDCPIDSLNFTAIIGKNGVGKSQVLKCLCEILNTAWYKYQGRKVKGLPYNYDLTIDIDGKFATINKDKRSLEVVNGLASERLISIATYITDKFPSASNEFYKYCGLRNESTPQMTSTRGLIRKTVDWMLDSLEEKVGFKNELEGLLTEMGLHPFLVLEYSIRYKRLFLRPDISADMLREIFSNQDLYFKNRKSQIWGTSAFKKIEDNQNEIENVARFLREQALTGNYKKSIYFTLLDNESISYDDVRALKLLTSIGVFSYPHLRIFKRRNNFEFIESSSGETSMLCSFLAIMSNIRNNSIILIDEPEQSCHPNWQINFLPLLKKIFHQYRSCHFIIATHSHFILSDLNPNDSSLIVLDYNDKCNIEDRATGINPYCWSSDDILYRVFQVRNTRNYVFEERMMRLYSIMEHKDQNQQDIRDLIVELKNYCLNDGDPLNILIKQAEKCLI